MILQRTYLHSSLTCRYPSARDDYAASGIHRVDYHHRRRHRHHLFHVVGLDCSAISRRSQLRVQLPHPFHSDYIVANNCLDVVHNYLLWKTGRQEGKLLV